MPITSDYHLHSTYSGDSEASMESMIERAISLNMKTLCFTEHQDMDFTYMIPEETGMFDLDTDAYYSHYVECKKKYAAKIKLLFGVELGLQPHLADIHLKYVKNYPFDFVIGSSHLCHKMDPYFPTFFLGRHERDAYFEYFLSIVENIKAYENYDIYGHLDYVVRYGPNTNHNYHYADYKDIFDEMLSLLIKKGKGIELNTGGFKYGLNEPNPCIAVLKHYKELGGEIITVGSDAHQLEYIAYDFDKACSILKECGFKYYTEFENRIPHFVAL